jgi:hypothetical protein
MGLGPQDLLNDEYTSDAINSQSNSSVNMDLPFRIYSAVEESSQPAKLPYTKTMIRVNKPAAVSSPLGSFSRKAVLLRHLQSATEPDGLISTPSKDEQTAVLDLKNLIFSPDPPSLIIRPLDQRDAAALAGLNSVPLNVLRQYSSLMRQIFSNPKSYILEAKYSTPTLIFFQD